MKKHTVGIVGCGYFGPNYIRVIHDLLDADVKFCADTDQKKLNKVRKKYPYIKTTIDYKELLKDNEVDSIIVATNPTSHYKIAEDSLKYGKNVLVEKPITVSSKKCLKLKKLARNKKKVLMVAHTYDYHMAVRMIKSLLEKNSLGKLVYISSVRKGLGPIREDVNVMWDLAPHDISMVLTLLRQKPLSVSARGICHTNGKRPDVAFINMKFPNKLIVNIHVSWLDPYKVRNMTFVGDKKMLLFDDTSVNEKVKIINKGVGYQKDFVNYGEFQYMLSAGDVTIPKFYMKEPLKEQVKHFFECVRQNKKPLSGADEAFEVVKILECAQRSLKKGGKEIKINSK